MCKKLEIFGDSILRGVMYDSVRGRYVLCGDRTKTLENLGVEAKNYSRLGATVTSGMELLQRKLGETEKGTTVLLEFGGNDCDFDWTAVSEDPLGDYDPHTPGDAFRAGYHKMIEFVRSRGAEPVMASLVPIDAEKYMKWITRGRNYENILAWLGDVSMLSRWQEQYNRAVERIAWEAQVRLLDLRSAFLTSHYYKDLIGDDGVHPTTEGHKLINAHIRSLVTA